MKVTRKRNGFTIRCNDSEFEALQRFVEISEGAGKLQGHAKNGYTRRVKGGNFLRIDEDKRAPQR